MTMSFRIHLIIVACTGFLLQATAQDALVPLGSLVQRHLEELQIRGLTEPNVHSALKPYTRGVSLSSVFFGWNSLTPAERRYLLADNDIMLMPDSMRLQQDSIVPFPESKRRLFRVFYEKPAYLFSKDVSDFSFRVNPVFHFSLGKENNREGLLFYNRRGIELLAAIDEKVFVYSNLIETQLRPASYIENFVNKYRALPDAGLYRDFDSRFFDGSGAYDYLASTGYLSFKVSQHIGIQFGHGKNFIGDGYRSLFLSDFGKNYFYLKLNTRVWKFHYQNLFAELSAREKLPGNVVVPKKYMAAHYLSFQPVSNLSLGIFEAVIFAREENAFELQYLNPVILYRSIEHHVGSPDNVLIGLAGTWDIAKRVRLYGQFLIDEFSFSSFFSSDQWWGNKHGLQFGARYLDGFGIRNLDLQLEFNRVRPFTYTHYDSLGSYAHFNQALAHPSGANFTEVLCKGDYRIGEKIFLTGKLFYTQSGLDTPDVFYGSDILHSNIERNADYGIEHRQGIPSELLFLSCTASYMIRHNVFLEAQFAHREVMSDAGLGAPASQFFTLGVRVNYFSSQDEF